MRNRLAIIAATLALAAAAVGCADTGTAGSDDAPSAVETSAEDRAAERAAKRERARQARRAERREAQRIARRRAARRAEAQRRARIRAEQQAAVEAAPACDPNYEGACLDPNASDYDCEGGSGDGPMYTGYVTVVGSDPHGLDSDGDGTGCE
ncbi:MAG TPA: hypothetical protein VK506_09750 [Conexibacter sp.]|nr:hypothetical protein [Conexibacter sp.]